MKWLVLSYTMPARFKTASRVRIWRKLQKAGAISLKNGIYVLPFSPDCQESIRWLVAEIEQEQGEAMVMEVHNFQNYSNDKVIDIFRKERSAEYQEIESLLQKLEVDISNKESVQDREKYSLLKKDVNKLKKSIDNVSRIDFFHACDKKILLDRLHSLQKTLITGNLILLILLSVGTLNYVVLRKMKEEQYTVARDKKHLLKLAKDKVAANA